MSFVALKMLALCGLLGASPQQIADGSYQAANALYDQQHEDMLQLAIEEYQRYLEQWPDGRFADDARYRTAKLYERLGEPRLAAMWYLQVLYLNPESLRLPAARDDLGLLLDREGELADRRAQYKLALDYEAAGATPQGRHRAYVDALLNIAESGVELETARELRRFLALYPEGQDNDRVQVELGRVLLGGGHPQRAVAAWQAVQFLYPESPLVPHARLRAADVTWKDLDRDFEALQMYEQLARAHPEHEAAATALYHMGEIEQKELKRYVIAIRDYDAVADRYPHHQHAVDALFAKAEIYQKEFKDPARAVQVYDDLSQRFSQDLRSARALYEAGRLCERELDNPARAIDYYARLGRDYPQYRYSAEMLYRAAELAEKQLADTARALDLYREVVDLYGATRWGDKARKKVGQLG